VLPLAALLTIAGCNYSFRAGSFPPPHIRTVSIQPFDNETARFELSAELYDQLLRSLPSALGIRTAGEEVADAVVRGSINRYDVIAPNYRAGAAGQPAEVLQRQVNISVSVQIVDLVENVILWESSSVTARGEFPEGSPEETGRLRAIELLVQEIVDGAQSNW
ncbi:MAG: LptE family protein, partial [Longimicrobiales bacterium]|nr:LptE family protein [Longimicrobiales bacterium]